MYAISIDSACTKRTIRLLLEHVYNVAWTITVVREFLTKSASNRIFGLNILLSAGDSERMAWHSIYAPNESHASVLCSRSTVKTVAKTFLPRLLL